MKTNPMRRLWVLVGDGLVCAVSRDKGELQRMLQRLRASTPTRTYTLNRPNWRQRYGVVEIRSCSACAEPLDGS